MIDISVTASALGAAAFSLLFLLLAAAHRGGRIGVLLIIACGLSGAWLAAQGMYHSSGFQWVSLLSVRLAELARVGAWYVFLAAIIASATDRAYRLRVGLMLGLGAMVIGLSAVAYATGYTFGLSVPTASKLLLVGQMTLAVIGLVLIEQIVRNADSDQRWALKHLCIGVGTIFLYDLYLYSDAVLFGRINPEIWSARGAVDALAVPFIALAATRNRDWELKVFVSRRVVFHGSTAFATGIYLLLMAGAGYYLKTYGGTWGGALQIAFSFAAGLVLLGLLLSREFRSRVAKFLATHFYQNKYDYGEVWLTFTRRLSGGTEEHRPVAETILRTIADIMDSTGGILWQKNGEGCFEVVARWSMDEPEPTQFPGPHPLIRRLADETVIDVRELAETAVVGEDDAVPAWMFDMQRAWLLVPVMHGEELLGFVLLAESRSGSRLTFEDRDLLRAVGRQAASYLALVRMSEALSEARQFEAFNQLSAFLVHDLKNVVAQLSLVVRNAERHRHNPEFIDDAFTTVGDAINRMNRMLGSLRQSHATSNVGVATRSVDLVETLQSAIVQCHGGSPVPEPLLVDGPVFVLADADRLQSVFVHLIQNAQDATPDDGRIDVKLSKRDGTAVIEIADTGCGMDRDFIQNRLFRPFDSTKGKAGMGIGAYESRHIVQSLAGSVVVDSEPGGGSRFCIELPLAANADVQLPQQQAGAA